MGNKVRKLEWVLADAEAKGRKTLISVGGLWLGNESSPLPSTVSGWASGSSA